MHCTVAEIQDRISYAEFCDWLAFMTIEPIGDRRLDLHFAMLSAFIANVNRASQSKVYEVKDFLIDFWEDRPKPSLLDKFMAMAQTINAQG